MEEQKQPMHQEQLEKPTAQEFSGSQGNTGQYGQGQYDSEGKPDSHGPQAQRMQPELSRDEKGKQTSSNDGVPLQDLQNEQNV